MRWRICTSVGLITVACVVIPWWCFIIHIVPVPCHVWLWRYHPLATPPLPVHVFNRSILSLPPSLCLVGMQVTQACIACRKSHVACDRELPCKRCVQKNIVCEMPKEKPNKRGPKPGSRSGDRSHKSEDALSVGSTKTRAKGRPVRGHAKGRRRRSVSEDGEECLQDAEYPETQILATSFVPLLLGLVFALIPGCWLLC